MMCAPALSVLSRSSRKYAASVERKWDPSGSMLWTPNLLTTMAPKSFKSMPGLLGFRAHGLVGLSMNSRNGHEATARRARGSVGNCRLGLDGKALRPALAIAPKAAQALEARRKLRRDWIATLLTSSYE